jgi:hypothetical protein
MPGEQQVTRFSRKACSRKLTAPSGQSIVRDQGIFYGLATKDELYGREGVTTLLTELWSKLLGKHKAPAPADSRERSTSFNVQLTDARGENS